MTTPGAPPAPADFASAASELGVTPDERLLQRTRRYLAALLETNRHTNLTAVTAPQQVWDRHILDSYALAADLRGLAEGARIVDLGSGGGMPAIPLAIARPDLHFTMVEATGKKAAFLDRVGRDLQLHYAVVSERIETFGQSDARESFDAVTARALAPLNVLLEYAIPLLRVGGELLALKGARAEEEVEAAAGALHTLHARVREVRTTASGAVICVVKEQPTDPRYPRRVGVPSKRPL